MTEAVAPVFSMASLTVSKTAMSTRLTTEVRIVSPEFLIVLNWSASTPMNRAFLPS